MRILIKITLLVLIISGYWAQNSTAEQLHPIKLSKPRNLQTLTITVEYLQAKPTDTLTLLLKNVLYRSDKAGIGAFKRTGVHRKFRFVIPVKEKYGYWNISKSMLGHVRDIGDGLTVTISDDFFWEAGDNIYMRLSNKEKHAGIHSSYDFSGLGAAKYEARSRIDSILENTNVEDRPIFDENFKYSDLGVKVREKIWNDSQSFKNKMSALSYGVLMTDAISKLYVNELAIKKIYFDEFVSNGDSLLKARFMAGYYEPASERGFEKLSPEFLGQSKWYFRYIKSEAQLQSYFLFGKVDIAWIFKELLKHKNHLVRDQAILDLFLTNKAPEDSRNLYRSAKAIIRDSNSLMVLKKIEDSAFEKKFINFELPDTDGKLIRFSDFKGKVVLIDFWCDGCGACRVFFKNTLSKTEKLYKENKDVVFISVSVDRNRDKWMEGIAGGHYTSKEVVNLYTNGMSTNHPIIKDNNILAYPHVILIDRNGKVKYKNSENLYDFVKLNKAINDLL